MVIIETIGFIAGLFVATSLLPQVIKSWKTKSTEDISILWISINFSGQLLWILYGFLIKSPSLVVMNGITFIMAIIILVLKLRNG